MPTIARSMDPLRLHSIAVLLSVVLTSGIEAQQLGDFYVFESLSNRILTASRGGRPTTLVQSPIPSITAALTEGPDDGSAIAITGPPTAVPRLYVHRIDRNGLSTLSTVVSSQVQGTDDIELDDAGDLLFLSRFNIAPADGIYRMPLQGASTFSLVASLPLRYPTVPVAFAEDVGTGYWWVLDSNTNLHRVSAGGSVFSIVRMASTSIRAGGLAVDPATEALLVASGNRLLRYDPVSPSFRTLLTLGGAG